LRWTFTLKATFDLTLSHATGVGERGFLRVSAGTVDGPSLRGLLSPQAGDWPLLRADGVMESDARFVIKADDGQHVYMRSRGFVLGDDAEQVLRADGNADPEPAHIRCSVQFDASVGPHQWMTRAVFVGTGRLTRSETVIDIFEMT